jgi:flagellar hook protein FlgE
MHITGDMNEMKKFPVFFLIALTSMLFTACGDSTESKTETTVGSPVIKFESSDDAPVIGFASSSSETGILYGFPSGPLLSTDSPTDLAIDGLGFFVVREPLSQNIYYTRLGAFQVNDEGYLVSSQGYIVQGWKIEQDTITGEIMLTGSITDVQVPHHSTPSSNEDSISIDETGLITYLDEQGDMAPVFNISLARVPDTHGLINIENDIFQQSKSSGQPMTSLPGRNGLGAIKGHTLEDVDLNPPYESRISIVGQDYLIVRDPEAQDQLHYVSDEFYRLNKDGQVVNSEGCILQGWKLLKNDENGEYETSGSVTDIEMNSFTVQPSATTIVTINSDLNSAGKNGSPGLNALSVAWDGDLSVEQHIDPVAFEYTTTVKVFDQLGSTHDITVYFDKGDTERTYEYIVTCNPFEDLRFSDGSDQARGRGLIGRGILSFTTEGELSDLTFEQLVSIDPGANGAWDFKNVTEDLHHNHFVFAVDFIGGISISTQQFIEINFGAMFDGSAWVPEATSTTFSPQSSAIFAQSANGYGAQAMLHCSIDRFGVITGYYSGGLELPLYRVALASF